MAPSASLSDARDASTGARPPPSSAGTASTNRASFELGALLGRGARSTVYEARDALTGELVALKIPTSAEVTSELRWALAREAKAVRAAADPHVVQLRVDGSEAPEPFLAFERLYGEDLGARLAREGRLSSADALHVVDGVLAALATAHAAGVVHRDIKPGNVFLVAGATARPQVKLLDFGIARLNGQGDDAELGVGTPLYMAPEQIDGRAPVDGRTDVYAAGALLFHALAGRAPHEGGPMSGLLVRICSSDAPDVRGVAPDVPEHVALAITRALSREPKNRFASAEQMRAALMGAAGRPRRLGRRRTYQRVLSWMAAASLSAVFVAPASPRRIGCAGVVTASASREQRCALQGGAPPPRRGIS